MPTRAEQAQAVLMSFGLSLDATEHRLAQISGAPNASELRSWELSSYQRPPVHRASRFLLAACVLGAAVGFCALTANVVRPGAWLYGLAAGAVIGLVLVRETFRHHGRLGRLDTGRDGVQGEIRYGGPFAAGWAEIASPEVVVNITKSQASLKLTAGRVEVVADGPDALGEPAILMVLGELQRRGTPIAVSTYKESENDG